MNSTTLSAPGLRPSRRPKIAWHNVVYLILSPLGTAILLPYFFLTESMTWSLAIFSFIFYSATMFSITGGYHRLFAHLSYQAKVPLRLFYLLIGASAFQGSALKWATDHRRHHRFVDTPDDPYNIRQGFVHAHIGWLMQEDNPKFKGEMASDLVRDPLVYFQHRFYVPLALFMGFGFPTLIGWWLGSPLGGFVLAGGLRLVLSNHTTFFINSLCHMVGKQPYTDENTARDSFLMAILAAGEGYHNFHHKFQADYRNGIRWYHWDPTKWLVSLAEGAGLAKNLKRTSSVVILKARMQMDEKRLLGMGVPPERISAFRERVEDAQKRWKELKEEYEKRKSDVRLRSQERLATIRTDMKRTRREFQAAWQLWRAYKNHAMLRPV